MGRYHNARTVSSILCANVSQLTHHRIWRTTSCRFVSSVRLSPASNPDEILRTAFESHEANILADPSRLRHNIAARHLKINVDELVIVLSAKYSVEHCGFSCFIIHVVVQIFLMSCMIAVTAVAIVLNVIRCCVLVRIAYPREHFLRV
jgi:hypothetical protein